MKQWFVYDDNGVQIGSVQKPDEMTADQVLKDVQGWEADPGNPDQGKRTPKNGFPHAGSVKEDPDYPKALADLQARKQNVKG